MKKHLLGVALITGLAASASAQLTINEFGYDDTGTDNICFVEIYNAGGAPVDLAAGGYRIVGIDLAPTLDINIALTGTVAAGDYYVLGQGVLVPNIDQTAAIDPQNDMESLALVDSTNAVIDSVVYERNKANIIIPAGFGEPAFDGVSATSGGGIWSNSQFIEQNVTNNTGFATNNTFSNATITDGRITDGYDTGNNELDFGRAVATPGAANNSIGTINLGALPYTNSFSGAEDTVVFDAAGNFSNGRIQDPTVADTLTGTYPSTAKNPGAIAASPGGGNCLIVWDDTGGGNSGVFNVNGAIADVEVEAYVYISAALAGADAEQSEHFIVRGRADGAANLGAPAEGTVGIYWRIANNVATSGVVNATLEQAVNGTVTQIGATVPVASAGWYRLLLRVQGTNVTGVLGGTYGDGGATGTVVSGTTTITRAGGIGFNYREAVAANTSARPLTYDDLAIRVPVASVSDWMLMNQ